MTIQFFHLLKTILFKQRVEDEKELREEQKKLHQAVKDIRITARRYSDTAEQIIAATGATWKQ